MLTAALSFVFVRENVLIPTELNGELLSAIWTVVFDIRLAMFAKLVLNCGGNSGELFAAFITVDFFRFASHGYQ